jgi:hypothetical protein
MKLTTFDEYLNENINEFGPLAGSGNSRANDLDNLKRDAAKKSERGDTVYIVGGKNGSYKLSKYFEKGNTYAAFYNGMPQVVEGLLEDENFLNEALKDITISDSEAEEIFDEIKRLTKLHKEKGFVSGEVSVDGFAKASGAFGLNPDDKNLKIAGISATTFGIFACITTQANIVVCYATLGYDTLKKKLKPGSYSLTFYNGRESHFNQMARQYKKTIYNCK